MPARQPRAENQILQLTPQPDTIPPEVRSTLALAALTVGSFRWRLRDAGYPFREPPNCDALIGQIDALLHPDELRRT